MIKLADKNSCTGCGACFFRCPKHCITMASDDRGIVMPIIDNKICIECHSCEKVCPILSPLSVNSPLKAYASWSNDKEERRTSASGGIAAELYKYALVSGYKIIGAIQNEDFTVSHILTDKIVDLHKIKNSKYVASDLYSVLPEIKRQLDASEKLLFIGLPCQVAALRKLFHDTQRILFVDVVCHGTTPQEYLDEHIRSIEKKKGKKAYGMSFRDPSAYTYTYTFTLYDKTNHLFYAQTPNESDKYQFGYHRGITYRENCYHCIFARTKRVSDITIGDYKDLGRLAPCSYNSHKVSCVLLNTKAGMAFFGKIVNNGLIHADQRPLEEPINGDRQLREPTRKIPERYLFEKLRYQKKLSYSKAINIAFLCYKMRMLRGILLRYPKRILGYFFNLNRI